MTNFLKHIFIVFLITGCQSLNNIGNNIGSTIGFIEEDPFAPTKIQTDYKNFLKSNWVKRNTNSFKFSELGKKRPAKNLFFASSGDRLFSIFDNLEVIDIKPSEQGGLKEVVAKLNGKGVFKVLKFESGVHRVQRVPETESQGRVHTSTCTVAVLPEVEEVQDINIDKNDLRVDTFRASGAGGQHVNKTDSAVRLTHIPSGLVVECQDGRSQHKNKEKALSLLAAKLKQQEIDNQQETIASERKILVGTGDRSEKIRTYNFPQGRMTDHRIKLTQHNLDQIMDGDIKTICDALLAENQLAMLSQLESE